MNNRNQENIQHLDRKRYPTKAMLSSFWLAVEALEQEIVLVDRARPNMWPGYFQGAKIGKDMR